MRQWGSLWGSILCVALWMVFFVFLSAAEAFFLPDTGQTTCYSDKGKGKVIACPEPGQSLAQDGSYSLFPPSYKINGDGTVTDNNTFLNWQQADDGVQRLWKEAESYCRGLSLGGHTDWRLPSKTELASIIDYGRFSPAIDSNIFENTKTLPYWSATEYSGDSASVWGISFYDGSANNGDKYSPAYARCVRGNMTLGDLRDGGYGNYTLIDQRTGLMWQQLEGGQMKWGYALDYCEGLVSGGYSDWRLPNARELESLYDSLEDYRLANASAPLSPSWSYYWSSTPSAVDSAMRWAVSFSNGATATLLQRDRDNYVRCVRGGSAAIADSREISVAPPALDFGYVVISEPKSLILKVSNVGADTLVIGSLVNPSSAFRVTSDGCSGRSLPGWDSCEVSVTFTAASPGVFTDVVTIPSDDADHASVRVGLWATATLPPGGRYLLPDTGQKRCFSGNDGNVVGCPPPGSPLAQDGSYTMNQMSFTGNGDGTMTDNNTLLMWQRVDDNIQRTWDDARSYCENLTLGGSTGWRLPTAKEIITITDYDFPFGIISPSVFPNAASRSYTTSEGGYMANQPDYVKCVRGGHLPYGPMADNGDGTFTDASTGLMWQQDVPSTWPDWASGVAYCEGLSLAGYTDWRLPNVKELVSLALYDPTAPVQSYYPYDVYWSSTTQLYTPLSYYSEAYKVNIARGGAGSVCCRAFTGMARVRCVRGGNVEFPSELSGTVTGTSTGLSLSGVAVTVTDSAGSHSAATGADGTYTLSGLAQGNFAVTFEKTGYIKQTVNGTLTAGQQQTLDIRLSPAPPLSISIGSPQDGAVVNTSFVSVTGSVGNDAGVTVNGVPASVNGSSFSASIPLGEGQNTITAAAQDQYGQTASQNITVTAILPKPPAITGLNASDITIDTATIAWATDQPADSLVEYGETTTYGNAKSDLNLTTSHSLSLNGLRADTTYHFRVSSKTAEGLSASSGDYTFTTSKFQTTFLGDFGDVAVMEMQGNYDANNPEGTMNYLPRQEIAREFIKRHSDDYDFMIIFSNFDFAMPQAEAKAFYLEVKNDVQGIGKAVFDDSALYGSSGKLQGMIDMGNISKKVSDPSEPGFEDTLTTLAHEQMHRWGAGVKFRGPGGNVSTALLGRDGAHWSYLLDSDASVMYGNDWQDNKDGTFTSTGKEGYYSALDLYLAGFYGKSQVPPMLLIDNPAIDPVRLPEVGTTISGTARYITIDDIIAAEGNRVPDVSTSQKTFKTAFILITAPNTFTGSELSGLENIRSGWAGRFAQLTGGNGSIADVAPNISIAVSTPSDGASITGPDVNVRGVVTNTTGKETGVTVNGIVADVYGNQFIANHVPLMEGANTLTVTATDTAGTTPSTSILVNAVAGDYIRLSSNIDSGIAPLEVTLRIDGSFSIDNSDMSVSGPAAIELIDNPAPDEYRIRITTEGIYYFSANVKGPDGQTYHDTIGITLMNREQLDRLLKAKWEGMKVAMSEKNVEKAMALFLGSSQERYRYIYTNLLDLLPTIAADMRPIEMIYEEDGVAEYRIRKTETVGEVTYYIYFVLDEKGTWKIQQF
jgi:hypothetical protein